METQYSDTDITRVTTIARNFLRDFPKYFQTSFDAVGRTYELGNPNIDAGSLWVGTYTTGSPTTITATTTDSVYYSLDSRNGVLRFNSTLAAGTKVLVEGYYYEWVIPTDLTFYARQSITQHVYNLDLPFSNMAQIVIDTIGMHTVVEALWGLMTEFSRDIDVTTSESIHIPASQRFRMVQSLLEYWMNAYNKQARALNIGVEKIEMLSLRRVSRSTGRLVPLYKERELNEYGPVTQVFPEIGKGDLQIAEVEEEIREDVYIDLEPVTGFSSAALLGF